MAIAALTITSFATTAHAGYVNPGHSFYGSAIGQYGHTVAKGNFAPSALPKAGSLRAGFAVRDTGSSRVLARTAIHADGRLDVQLVDTSGRTAKAVNTGYTVKAGQKVTVEVQVKEGATADTMVRAWPAGSATPGWQLVMRGFNTGATKGSVRPYHYLSSGAGQGINVAVTDVSVYQPSAPAPAPAPTPTGPGVPSGTSLTKMYGHEDGTDDGVLSLHADRTPHLMNLNGKEIYARVEVLKGNARIENSRITGSGLPSTHTAVLRLGHDYAHQASLVVKQSTLQWDNSLRADDTRTANVVGLKGANITAEAIEIRNVSDGVNIDGDNFVLRNSLVHNAFNSVDTRQRDGQAHNDGVQVSGGNNIVLRGNTIEGFRYSAAMIVTDRTNITNMRIENNKLDHGSCTINARAKNGRVINSLTVTGNTFGTGQANTPGGTWGCHKLSTPTHGMLTSVTGATVSNNKRVGGGTAYLRDADARKYLG